MEELMEKFKGTGFKLTPQRMMILKFLEDNESHPTAEEILSGVRASYPTVSMATIYNTLHALRELGELQELTLDPERRHYDPRTDAHSHLVCSSCGEIKDIEAVSPEKLMLPEEVEKEFKVTSSRVNFFGLCKKCL